MVQLNFDPRAQAPELTPGFAAWPGGWYKVIITKSDWKPTKSADGSMYLQLDLNCTEGEYANAINFLRLNLGHKSSAATVQRAAAELACIAYVCGLSNTIPDSAALHNIPFWIEMSKTESDKGASNSAINYRNIQGQTPEQLATIFGGKGAAQAAPAQRPNVALAPQGPAPFAAPAQGPAPVAAPSPFPPQGAAPAAPQAAAPQPWQQQAAAQAAAPPWGSR
jgi:hypothetical protein